MHTNMQQHVQSTRSRGHHALCWTNSRMLFGRSPSFHARRNEAGSAPQSTVHASAIYTQQQAVVIGSGLAGLAAAEMLSKHFDKVVVLEKDCPRAICERSATEVASDKTARRGVTQEPRKSVKGCFGFRLFGPIALTHYADPLYLQYSQLHCLLSQGLKAFDTIFSNRFTPAVTAAGANLVDYHRAFRFIHPQTGVWQPNTRAKEPALTAVASRHVLETTARKLVEANDKVEFQYGIPAAGLQLEGVTEGLGSDSATARHAVTGVRLTDGSVLDAALLVDCSGRHSAMPDWLAAAGYQKPRVTTATANCGYASWFVKLTPEVEQSMGDVHGFYIMADPPERSLGMFWRVEQGMWMVAIGGFEGLHPPQQDDKLQEWAAKYMWHPAAATLLEGSTVLTPASRFYGVSSSWRHYEEMKLPEGLLLIGDAVCSFSPIYGQGMTVAALEVQKLDKLLTQRNPQPTSLAHNTMPTTTTATKQHSRDQAWLQGLSSEMQQVMYPLINGAWSLAAGEDSKWPTATSSEESSGLQAAVEKFMQGYVSTVTVLAATDSLVSEALTRVIHMLDPPPALLQPAVLGRVVLHKIATTMPQQTTSRTAESGSRSSPKIETASLSEMLRIDTGIADSTRSSSSSSGTARQGGVEATKDVTQQAAAAARR